MNLQPPAPHINRHILETLYNSGAPKVCTLTDFGPDSAFENFQALSYMAEQGWTEKSFGGRLCFWLTDYGVHLVQLGLVIENAGAVDDDPGDVSEHFLRQEIINLDDLGIQVSCGHGARRESVTAQAAAHETPAGKHFADNAREASAQPPVGQASPVGNGARQGQSSAGRALEIVGRAADNEAPVSILASGAGAPKYNGSLLPSMIAMVEDKLAKYYSPCPQGDDCVGDGKHRRTFNCDHCDFVGCSACLDAHEAEPHWGDSDTARERQGVQR